MNVTLDGNEPETKENGRNNETRGDRDSNPPRKRTKLDDHDRSHETGRSVDKDDDPEQVVADDDALDSNATTEVDIHGHVDANDDDDGNDGSDVTATHEETMTMERKKSPGREGKKNACK